MIRRTIGMGAETIGFVVGLNIRALFGLGFCNNGELLIEQFTSGGIVGSYGLAELLGIGGFSLAADRSSLAERR